SQWGTSGHPSLIEVVRNSRWLDHKPQSADHHERDRIFASRLWRKGGHQVEQPSRCRTCQRAPAESAPCWLLDPTLPQDKWYRRGGCQSPTRPAPFRCALVQGEQGLSAFGCSA